MERADEGWNTQLRLDHLVTAGIVLTAFVAKPSDHFMLNFKALTIERCFDVEARITAKRLDSDS